MAMRLALRHLWRILKKVILTKSFLMSDRRHGELIVDADVLAGGLCTSNASGGCEDFIFTWVDGCSGR